MKAWPWSQYAEFSFLFSGLTRYFMEGFHGSMLCGGRGLSPLASTPDGRQCCWQGQWGEGTLWGAGHVAEHWDTAQAHGSLWGRWDAWYPVMHHINGREALVTLFTACNPEQGPSVTNKLSLKLQKLSSPSRMELGTRLSSPLICTSHMTLKSLTTFRLSPSQISSKFSLWLV